MIEEILKHTIMITGFVLVMMLVMEYITVQTHGNWTKPLQRSTWLQIILAALLGILPGCLGAFVAVSLYAHQIFNFAALVTVMIATSGDEAFVMFSMIPGKAFMIMGVLLGVSIITGLILNAFMKNKTLMVLPDNYLKVHDRPTCVCFKKAFIVPQLKDITFQRALLLTIGVIFLVFLLTGGIGPPVWNWKRVVFLIVALIALFIVTTVPDHFIDEHLWEHIIKKHLPRIFLWTFGAFLVIHYIENFLDIKQWIQDNYLVMLAVALLVGLIPESGPHIVFITLFVGGHIPLSILLANSISQDGHGSIPLLAESRRSFLAMKGVNMGIGLIVGLGSYYLLGI